MVEDRISEIQIKQVSQNASQREKDMGSLKVRMKIKTVWKGVIHAELVSILLGRTRE